MGANSFDRTKSSPGYGQVTAELWPEKPSPIHLQPVV